MRLDILTDLLAGRRLDSQEREELDLDPDEMLHYKDVRRHLEAVISECEWFPREYVPHVPGQPVDERITIQRLAHGYVCHAQRHHPTDPRVPAEESHRRFVSARGAADYFLRWEHHLPGDLDGWNVV